MILRSLFMHCLSSDDIINKINTVKDLPTLPVIAMEVNRMLGDERT
jgi:hypothetical protein